MDPTHSISLIERYGSFGALILILLGVAWALKIYVPVLIDRLFMSIEKVTTTFETTLKTIREDCRAEHHDQKLMFLKMMDDQRALFQKELDLYRTEIRTPIEDLLGKLEKHDTYVRNFNKPEE